MDIHDWLGSFGYAFDNIDGVLELGVGGDLT